MGSDRRKSQRETRWESVVEPGKSQREARPHPGPPPGERENFRALCESSMASVASAALLAFRPAGAPTPVEGSVLELRQLDADIVIFLGLTPPTRRQPTNRL